MLQFDADKGPGLLDAPLRDDGFALDVRVGERGHDTLAGHAGLIVLGGLADPDDDADPAIAAGVAITRDALGRRVPVLGVCLGAELLARAAGGGVHRCPPEYGFPLVALTPPAAGDPVLGGLPQRFRCFQAHGFVCDPPAGAEVLARSGGAVQAFRHGATAWGVQFHLEPTAAMIADWVTSPPVRSTLDRNGVDADAIARDAERVVPDWVGWTADIARRFGTVVRAAARR